MPTGVVLQNTPHKARVSSRCAPRRYSLTWTPWVQLDVTQSQPNLAANWTFALVVDTEFESGHLVIHELNIFMSMSFIDKESDGVRAVPKDVDSIGDQE